MLPAQRRCMAEPCVGGRLSYRTQVGHAISNIGGIPEDDRGDDEVEPRGAKLLGLDAAIGDPALLDGADDLHKGMTLFALVEPGVAAPPQFRALQPVEHEQHAFDATQPQFWWC